MARRPSVFVRPLSMDEGRKLQKITRSAKDPVRLRRAIVVMMSGQGQTVRDITSLLQVSEDYVRDVIHAFNERGFDALDPNGAGVGRRPSMTRPDRRSSRWPDRPPGSGAAVLLLESGQARRAPGPGEDRHGGS